MKLSNSRTCCSVKIDKKKDSETKGKNSRESERWTAGASKSERKG